MFQQIEFKLSSALLVFSYTALFGHLLIGQAGRLNFAWS